MKDKIKKFVKDHDEALIIGTVIVLGTVATYAAVAKITSDDVINVYVHSEEKPKYVLVHYKSGKIRTFLAPSN